jgi:hypothetical protein
MNLQLQFMPGSKFAYCSVNYHLLSYLIYWSTGMDESNFAKKYLLNPLGIHDFLWDKDNAGVTRGWGDSYWHPLDLAKIAYLFTNKGKWADEQIISESWVEEAAKMQMKFDNGNGYGYGWWVSKDFDNGLFEAIGRGDNKITVVPKEKMVVVWLGCSFDTDEIGPFIRQSMKSRYPLPPNTRSNTLLAEKIADAGRLSKEPSNAFAKPLLNNLVLKTEYQFESNRMGLDKFKFFLDSVNKELKLALYLLKSAGQPLVRVSAIGLEGKYKISNNGKNYLPIAIKGQWDSTGAFNLDYYEFANNHKYDIKISFEGNQAIWTVSDITGLMRAYKIVAYRNNLCTFCKIRSH